MIKVLRNPEPSVLSAKKDVWTKDYLSLRADLDDAKEKLSKAPKNTVLKEKVLKAQKEAGNVESCYNHPDVKKALKE